MTKSLSNILLEILPNSFRCLPLSSIAKLMITLVSPCKPPFILVNLSSDLKAYVPSNMIFEVWKNILHIYYYADYEMVRSFIPKEGWVVIDVGAFIGLWSLRVSELVGEEGLVIGLEPNPSSYSLALRNVLLNGLKNVRLLNYALGVNSGEELLYVTPYPGNSSLLSEYANDMGGIKRVIKVRTITLVELMDKLGIYNIDLLKLDVEGYELELIKSWRRILSEGVIKRLIIEVHKQLIDTRMLITILEDSGYDVIIYDPFLPTQTFVYARASN